MVHAAMAAAAARRRARADDARAGARRAARRPARHAGPGRTAPPRCSSTRPSATSRSSPRAGPADLGALGPRPRRDEAGAGALDVPVFVGGARIRPGDVSCSTPTASRSSRPSASTRCSRRRRRASSTSAASAPSCRRARCPGRSTASRSAWWLNRPTSPTSARSSCARRSPTRPRASSPTWLGSTYGTPPVDARSSPRYAAATDVSAWPGRSLFSGTNWLAMNVAPCGSAITVIRTHGASNGGDDDLAAEAAAAAAVASASSTPNVTLQCGGVSGWSSGIGLIAGDDVLEAGRRADLGHPLAHARGSLLQVVAVAGQRPRRAAAEVEGPPAEHRAVERLRGLEVAGHELVEVQRPVLVDHPGARCRFGLPDAERRALRIGEHGHPAGVHDVEGLA